MKKKAPTKREREGIVPKMPFHKCNRNYDEKIIRMRIKSRNFSDSFSSDCVYVSVYFFISLFSSHIVLSFCVYKFVGS